MQVAIYGGSFNPPHIGHAMVASWLLWTQQADAVWLLPTYQHAFGKGLAPWSHRLRWVKAMAEHIDGPVSVCTIEEQLAGTSYTIDTLTELARRHPEHRFRLVIGSDNLAVLDKWKDWGRIQADFAPIVVGRAGYEAPPDCVVFPQVSSTDIRQRIAQGRPVKHLLLAAVDQVIDPSVFL